MHIYQEKCVKQTEVVKTVFDNYDLDLIITLVVKHFPGIIFLKYLEKNNKDHMMQRKYLV